MSYSNQPCLFPWVHMYYFTDKKVYPCCKLAGNKKFEIGSNTEDVSALWNSSIMKEMRKGIIRGREPLECFECCYDNINPLHIHVPQEIRQNQKTFFEATGADGFFEPNLILWNVNESNVCNFACTYCCNEFSNQFEGGTLKTFDTTEEMMKNFTPHASKIKSLYLSSGETHLQPGYYKMLEYLLENNITNIEINVHTNLSGYKFGNKNLFKILNQFNNVTVFASLDSYGVRAEYIRYGTDWSTVEANREVLFDYPNIKFAVQTVITNLNLWSLPDFHYEWYNKGFLRKDNIRYFPLTSPEELHISVLSNNMKKEITSKYINYLEFLDDEHSTILNGVYPRTKVQEIINHMNSTSPKVNLGKFEYFILKQSVKSKMNFKKTFPEFC